MDEVKLNKILESHKLWLHGKGRERANLQEADLRAADLQGADLREADLWEADLSAADLRGADLRAADLQGADLLGANLRGADLQEAYLLGANLLGANLRGADLRGAYLQEADLQEADLRGAVGNMKEIKSLQIETYTITYTSQVLQIGCKQYPFDKWWSFSDAEIYQMDGTKAVEWWHKYKELIRSIVELSPAVPTNGEENESI